MLALVYQPGAPTGLPVLSTLRQLQAAKQSATLMVVADSESALHHSATHYLKMDVYL